MTAVAQQALTLATADVYRTGTHDILVWLASKPVGNAQSVFISWGGSSPVEPTTAGPAVRFIDNFTLTLRSGLNPDFDELRADFETLRDALNGYAFKKTGTNRHMVVNVMDCYPLDLGDASYDCIQMAIEVQ